MKKNSATKKYYDKKYKLWTERKTNSFIHEKQFRLFSDLLPEKAKVLDIGCAGGIHIPLFLGIGRKLKYYGIDFSQSFIKVAQSRYPQLPIKQADILSEEGLPKVKFAGFWAGAVLMHLKPEDLPEALDNIEKITTKKAIGYLSLPNEHPNGTTDVKDDTRHFTLLTPKEQKKLIRDRGWKILKSGKYDGFSKKGIWCWYIVELP